MKFAWIGILAVVLLGGGEHERGLELYEQGNYEEAVAAFRAAEGVDGPSPELSYNLALALWKAGSLDEAETAAEAAATLSGGELSALRDGILGNLRYASAEQKRAEDLQVALDFARQARSHYLRGAVRPDAPVELARNLERAQRLIDELEKEIEEQEKEEEEKQDEEKQDDEKEGEEKDQDEKKDDEKKDDGEEGDEKKDQDPKENEDGQDQEPQGEPKPEDGDGQPDEPKPEDQPEDQPEEQQQEESKPPPAPGEQQEGRELTPEEKKRLLDKLEALEEQRVLLRQKQKAARPKVEKDW